MDPGQLIEILRATIDPNQRENAEKQLEQVHKIIGFAPSLLQVVMTNAVDMPVRQAGAIYLKNLVMQFWQEREPTGTTLHFHVHEQDRAMVRDAIVDAMVHAPDPIRVQLAVCLTNILKSDFPGRWTGIVDKVSIYLQSPESAGWVGSVLALYQLVKNYEYKKPEEREPLREAMQLLLPLLYQRMVHLLQDPSEASVLVQKLILKVFFALVQYHLPLALIRGDVCTQWMEVFRVIIERPVPDVANQVDEEERPDLPWWKCKKWAFHIVSRLFERYGSPGSVTKEYREFADFYLKAYSEGILQVVLKVLDQYRQKIYVSPRVLQHALNYVKQAVAHAFTWKFLKPHIVGIILEVVFPLLCYTDQDDELWNTDPHEYIRLKFDVFEDFVSPVTAAQTLAHTVCKQRKGVLQKTMAYVNALLTNPACNPRQKDGALHLVGTVATLLLKRKLYKDQVEPMLVAHVLPEFASPHGFLRARACWVLHHFCELHFRGQTNLGQSVECLVGSLLRDQDLPVRVEAAVALQAFLSAQEKAQAAVEPHIKEISLELLKIIRETENDDLISVMQKIVYMYTEQITPIAVEMTQHLVGTFLESGSGDGGDEKAMVAMGVLTTLDTLVSVLIDQQEIVSRLEPPLLDLVVNHVLGNSLMEFYEEALSLLCSLSSRGPLSPAMWKAFEALYQTFQKDGFDFFTDMMPALHNFVTVDTPAFVSNENHLLAMYNMCKALLEGSPGEDAECHAAKLLEVIILQCKGQIDQCIPSFVELVLRRLTKEITSPELTAMCLQVVVAALYYNPGLLFETLVKLQPQEVPKPLVDHFISMWMDNVDCFLGLHDRKICVLGLCTLISTPGQKPQALMEAAGQIMPAMLMLFDGLKRAYAFKAQEEEDSDEEEEEDEYDGEVLDSDEDDVEDESAEYLARIARKAKKGSPFPVTSATIEDGNEAEDGEDEDDDDEDEDDNDEDEETALEAYTTPLDEEDCPVDEYQVFKEVMQTIQNSDPTWFNTLTSVLNAEQQKALQEVYLLADRRKAVSESLKIERSGGYVFQNQTVPTSFNFGETSFNFGGAPKC